jgi:hypothetical protein
VTWDQFTTQANHFIDGVAVHYELDQRQAQLISVCTEVTDPEAGGTLEEARSSVDRMCSLIDAADSSFLNFLTGGTITIANENCKLAREALADGRVDDALEISANTCDDVSNQTRPGSERSEAKRGSWREGLRGHSRAAAAAAARHLISLRSLRSRPLPNN